MKKVAVFFLAIIMLMGLCACGDGPNIKQTEPNISMQPEVAPTAGNTDPFDWDVAPSEMQNDNTKETLPAIGETVLWSMRERDDRPATIQLHEDKSCTVDGVSYTWTQEADRYGRALVRIMDGETEVYRLEGLSGNGVVFVYRGEEEFIYMDMAVYDKVVLTPENWYEYFELEEELCIITNAFGDFKQFDIDYWFALKDSYFARFYNIPSQPWYNQDEVAVEVQYIGHYADYTLDVQNNTYTVSDLYGGEVETTVCTSTQGGDYFHLFIKGVYGYSVSGTTNNGKYGYPTDFTVLRVKGYLWLRKQ